MTKINRNIIDQFLKWEGGQRLFNFAYSVGAAIVILGALFKILHLPGGNTLLMIGMGTEVLMFLITAFDRPPKEYKWEEVFPQLKNTEDVDEEIAQAVDTEEMEDAAGEPAAVPAVGGGVGGGTIIIGGGGGSVGGGRAAATGDDIETVGGVTVHQGVAGGVTLSGDDAAAMSESIHRMHMATEQLAQFADMAQTTRDYMTQMATISDQLHRLSETTRALNHVSEVLLESYRAITENSTDITRHSVGYVQEMETLNRNINGLNTIYNIQLKSVSSQLDAIDRVNRGIKDISDMYERTSEQSASYVEETQKMARNMQELNRVYESMIQAMSSRR